MKMCKHCGCEVTQPRRRTVCSDVCRRKRRNQYDREYNASVNRKQYYLDYYYAHHDEKKAKARARGARLREDAEFIRAREERRAQAKEQRARILAETTELRREQRQQRALARKDDLVEKVVRLWDVPVAQAREFIATGNFPP